MIEVTQLHPFFVGEVSGVDLREPVDAETLGALIQAIDTHGLLVFHDQEIDDEQQLAFSANFGELRMSSRNIRSDYTSRIDPRMTDISNLDANGDVLKSDDRERLYMLANRFWHTDNAFRLVPAKYSLLSARVVPPDGGETEFTDMRAAYDALPDKMKARLEGKVAIHSIMHSRAVMGFADYSQEELDALPPVPHAMVRTHPGSGRKALYIASYAHEIQGMDTPEARMLLHDLMEHATQRQFVHTHTWRAGDLVMWDNRCTMHRARDYDMTQRRDLHRSTVMDDGPTVSDAQVA